MGRGAICVDMTWEELAGKCGELSKQACRNSFQHRNEQALDRTEKHIDMLTAACEEPVSCLLKPAGAVALLPNKNCSRSAACQARVRV